MVEASTFRPSARRRSRDYELAAHPEASHSLAIHPGDLVGLAWLLENEQTSAETRDFPDVWRRAVRAPL
jgi:hypothetical protein